MGYGQKRKFQNSNDRSNNNNNNQQDIKNTWAVYTKIKEGKNEGLWAVNAFRKTQHGLQKASCFPVDGSTTHVGAEKGHEFIRYAVTISNATLGTSQVYWCLMRLDTKIIVIKELGLCITPNGSGPLASGKRVSGYFGRNHK